MNPVSSFKEEKRWFLCAFYFDRCLAFAKTWSSGAMSSGYKVDASEFKLDTSQVEKSYKCSVPDSDSMHAVEVYLDDYGWVRWRLTNQQKNLHSGTK